MKSSPPQSCVHRRSGWTLLLVGWLALATTGCAMLNKPKVERAKFDNEFSCGEKCPAKRP